jgi:hypothetical protein
VHSPFLQKLVQQSELRWQDWPVAFPDPWQTLGSTWSHRQVDELKTSLAPQAATQSPLQQMSSPAQQPLVEQEPPSSPQQAAPLRGGPEIFPLQQYSPNSALSPSGRQATQFPSRQKVKSPQQSLVAQEPPATPQQTPSGGSVDIARLQHVCGFSA